MRRLGLGCLRVALGALCLAPSIVGCTCSESGSSGGRASTSASSSASVNASDAAIEQVDLFLHHHALFAFGNTTPLPIANDFQDAVPELEPSLSRAAQARALLPVRIRIDRDVPYGQVTRLMQAGYAYRITTYHVVTERRDGTLATVDLKAPSPLPRGDCWATAWCSPDGRVQVGLDAKGVIVSPKDGEVNAKSVASVLRRFDERCKDGPTRIYAQPSGAWERPFDLALGLAAEQPAPHLSTLQLQVPSIGPMDSPQEVVP